MCSPRCGRTSALTTSGATRITSTVALRKAAISYSLERDSTATQKCPIVVNDCEPHHPAREGASGHTADRFRRQGELMRSFIRIYSDELIAEAERLSHDAELTFELWRRWAAEQSCVKMARERG